MTRSPRWRVRSPCGRVDGDLLGAELAGEAAVLLRRAVEPVPLGVARVGDEETGVAITGPVAHRALEGLGPGRGEVQPLVLRVGGEGLAAPAVAQCDQASRSHAQPGAVHLGELGARRGRAAATGLRRRWSRAALCPRASPASAVHADRRARASSHCSVLTWLASSRTSDVGVADPQPSRPVRWRNCSMVMCSVPSPSSTARSAAFFPATASDDDPAPLRAPSAPAAEATTPLPVPAHPRHRGRPVAQHARRAPRTARRSAGRRRLAPGGPRCGRAAAGSAGRGRGRIGHVDVAPLLVPGRTRCSISHIRRVVQRSSPVSRSSPLRCRSRISCSTWPTSRSPAPWRSAATRRSRPLNVACSFVSPSGPSSSR